MRVRKMQNAVGGEGALSLFSVEFSVLERSYPVATNRRYLSQKNAEVCGDVVASCF